MLGFLSHPFSNLNFIAVIRIIFGAQISVAFSFFVSIKRMVSVARKNLRRVRDIWLVFLAFEVVSRLFRDTSPTRTILRRLTRFEQ